MKMIEVTFYIYFANNDDAETSKNLLASQGFEIDLHILQEEYSLQLKKQVNRLEDIKTIEKNLLKIAKDNNGEYDGHELKI